MYTLSLKYLQIYQYHHIQHVTLSSCYMASNMQKGALRHCKKCRHRSAATSDLIRVCTVFNFTEHEYKIDISMTRCYVNSKDLGLQIFNSLTAPFRVMWLICFKTH